ncbi:MAG: DsbA family protein [Deltaproteobacteria bacterium]|nr:DsbA family protein [Deltaproteobacteria bacterium]
MHITRREFCRSTAAVALSLGVLGVSALPPFESVALADPIPAAELMKPGSLPDIVMGNDKASVIVIEYASMTCPHCAHFHENTFPELKKRYIDTGKVRYVLRDSPLSIHPQAPKAAEAAHCAGEQSQYWAMHDVLFRNQRDLSVPALKRYAAGLGLDETKFAECLDSGRRAGEVKKEQQAATEAGVRGTPTFFVGPSTSGGTINGRRLVGAQPLAAFQALIESQLEAAGKD